MGCSSPPRCAAWVCPRPRRAPPRARRFPPPPGNWCTCRMYFRRLSPANSAPASVSGHNNKSHTAAPSRNSDITCCGSHSYISSLMPACCCAESAIPFVTALKNGDCSVSCGTKNIWQGTYEGAGHAIDVQNGGARPGSCRSTTATLPSLCPVPPGKSGRPCNSSSNRRFDPGCSTAASDDGVGKVPMTPLNKADHAARVGGCVDRKQFRAWRRRQTRW